jgi:hypothetical protein
MKTPRFHPARRFAPIVVLLVAPATLVSAATTVISDDMSAPSYSSFSFNSNTLGGSNPNPDDISSESSNAIGSGGNSGGYLEVTHHLDVARDGFGAPLNGDGSAFVQSFFKQQAASYTPSIDGGIATIQFSIDLLITEPFGSVFFTIDDSLGGNAAGFMNLPPSTTGWQTFTSPLLSQANFSSRDFDGSAPFRFGFGFTSNTDVTAAPVERVIAADNFVITINQVPEPSTGALAGAGLAVAAFLRRRRLAGGR